MKKITAISVFYNRESSVQPSVASLVDQTCDDCEIVLVDDGSQDGTLDALNQFAGGRVNVRTSPNIGFTRQLIRTIASTQSEYIAIHGSGDISLPERFAKQSAIMDADASIGVVGSHMIEDRGPDCEPVYLRRRVDRDSRKRLLQQNFFAHGEVMFRRNAYDQVGGYRAFFQYAQDFDLWCRMSRVTGFANCDDFLYRRSHQPDGVSFRSKTKLAQVMYCDFAKHCHRAVLDGRPDPLEDIGPAAILLRRRSRPLGLWMDRQAMKLARVGRQAEAESLIHASIQYRSSPHAWLSAAVVKFPSVSKGWLQLKQLLRGRSSSPKAASEKVKLSHQPDA